MADDQTRILVIDDEPVVRESVEARLRSFGYRVDVASTGAEGIGLFREDEYDVVITDLKMPHMSGIDILRAVREIDEEAVILLMTAYATVETALEALKLGAAEYFPKPVNFDHIDLVIRRSLEKRRLARENARLRRDAGRREQCGALIGSSLKMNEVYRQIDAAAKTDRTVLLQGETGTGKELAARAIHELGPRSDHPFIPVNCGGLPQNLLESELFGYVKGAFSGAEGNKQGLFEAARGGTILLDEIEAASPQTQITLLRVLDQKRIRPVGAQKELHVNVRVIVATNEDLEGLVADGRFREDLFFRIIESMIWLPPLRDRPEDIPPLVRAFCAEAQSGGRKQIRRFSPQALTLLMQYAWPGNVRELKNLVLHAAASCPETVIRPANLPPRVREEAARRDPIPTLHEQEKALLTEALQRSASNKTEAARLLGVSRKTVYSLMRKHGVGEE